MPNSHIQKGSGFKLGIQVLKGPCATCAAAAACAECRLSMARRACDDSLQSAALAATSSQRCQPLPWNAPCKRRRRHSHPLLTHKSHLTCMQGATGALRAASCSLESTLG